MKDKVKQIGVQEIPFCGKETGILDKGEIALLVPSSDKNNQVIFPQRVIVAFDKWSFLAAKTTSTL